MLVLGIESSCDETSAAVVNEKKEILAHVLFSQIKEHEKYGGVVPEVAARAHLEKMDTVIEETLRKANVGLEDLSGIAGVAGPGLIGGVIIGLMTAKSLAFASSKPFIAVNHLEAHALMPRFTNEVEFPFLLLLTSGGHCQLLIVSDVGKYEYLGGTLDDSVGEAFDKTAKLLGLGYPGGPVIESAAEKGTAGKFKFTAPLIHQNDCNFSFSGLKTQVRTAVDKGLVKTEADKNDLAAEFQETVIKALKNKTGKAISVFKGKTSGKHLVLSGGVAANKAVRKAMETCAAENGLTFAAPPISLCTDNGVMIAWAGLERLRKGMTDDFRVKARPRWPLGS